MYLSQLILDPRSRQVRSEVSQPYELHRTLMRAFPNQAQGGSGRVLFRLDSPTQPDQIGLKLLIQSDQEPNWAWLDSVPTYLLPGTNPNPASKPFEPTFQPGQRLAFRLQANPTVKREGKRLGLYREEEQHDWLARKAEQGGFTLLTVNIISEGKVGGKIHRSEEESHTLNLLAVRFDGVLQVTDPAKFLKTLQQGIGSGKGLGFGLLSLARV